MRLATTLRRLAAERSLRAIDVELAVRLGELGGRELAGMEQSEGALSGPPFNEASCLAGLLASRAIETGHACVPLTEIDTELRSIPWPAGRAHVAQRCRRQCCCRFERRQEQCVRPA